MCMVIRQKNMFFGEDRRTEEHRDCLRGVRQENRRTWGLFARGKTGEHENMGIACGDKTGEQKNMFFG